MCLQCIFLLKLQSSVATTNFCPNWPKFHNICFFTYWHISGGRPERNSNIHFFLHHPSTRCIWQPSNQSKSFFMQCQSYVTETGDQCNSKFRALPCNIPKPSPRWMRRSQLCSIPSNNWCILLGSILDNLDKDWGLGCWWYLMDLKWNIRRLCVNVPSPFSFYSGCQVIRQVLFFVVFQLKKRRQQCT